MSSDFNNPPGTCPDDHRPPQAMGGLQWLVQQRFEALAVAGSSPHFALLLAVGILAARVRVRICRNG